MKRHGNLFDKIISKDNLRLAHKNSRKGKTHYKEVKTIDENIDKYINELHYMLKEELYTVGEYKRFVKNDKGKLREIYKLDYWPDRVIHHAILQILEPIWKPMLIKHTYQSIKGRGVKQCKIDVHKCIKKNTNKDLWVLKVDINKFYPSIDNVILKEIVRKKIKCKKTLLLLDKIIDSKDGLPIGNYISQYLGNMYLMYLDQYIKTKEATVGYFRYCDDIVIMSDNKANIKRLYKELKTYIESRLNLKIKKNDQYFRLKSRKLDFVGFVFNCNGNVKLRKIIKKNMIKSLKSNNVKSHSAYYGWVLESRAFSIWNKYYKGDKKYGNKNSNVK